MTDDRFKSALADRGVQAIMILDSLEHPSVARLRIFHVRYSAQVVIDHFGDIDAAKTEILAAIDARNALLRIK